jgi:endonuclease/exonuclease/phosphatase family metal-dependent hydrolase
MKRGRNIHLERKYLLLLLLLIVLAILYVFNASIPGKAAEGCPQGCATASARSAGPLRVVDLNMLHGFPDFKDLPLRIDLIASEIRRLDADVVLLEEVPWTRLTGNGAQSLAQKLGYNYLYYRAEGNRHLIFFETGQAILSRFPLKDTVTSVLPPQAGFFESRVALGATALTPWGEIPFFVAHLTDKKDDPGINRGQAASLKAFVEAHTTGLAVVGGDFNAQEHSPQIVALSNSWMDTYRALHPGDPGLTCCIDDLHAAPGEPLVERIDYIFLAGKSGKSSRLVSAKHAFDQPFPVGAGWQWASDHTGLLVELDPCFSLMSNECFYTIPITRANR